MTPSLEDYWRGIVLYGKNVASYKFALAKSLLEIKPDEGQLIQLEELAPVFSKHICEHLKKNDRQGTSGTSKFLEACRAHNNGDITYQSLLDTTTKYGFVNVIEAFHVVGGAPIDTPFFIDERKSSKGIKIATEFSQLKESEQFVNFNQEAEARWNLVETSWKLDISRNMLRVDIDESLEHVIVFDNSNRRINVTSSRDALNGYQKGYCFYCENRMIDLSGASSAIDVDHFFANKLKQANFKGIDGVWNLVLSCVTCNRGEGGKFDKLPTLKLLQRLSVRNEHLIKSHHPLRDTLIRQTGKGTAQRNSYLNDTWDKAKSILIHEWEPGDCR